MVMLQDLLGWIGGSWGPPSREKSHQVFQFGLCACHLPGEIAPKALQPLGQDLLILSLASNDLKHLPPKVFEGLRWRKVLRGGKGGLVLKGGFLG